MPTGDFGGTDSLPPLTKFVIGVSHGVVDKLPIIIGGGIAAFFGISYSYSTKKGSC